MFTCVGLLANNKYRYSLLKLEILLQSVHSLLPQTCPTPTGIRAYRLDCACTVAIKTVAYGLLNMYVNERQYILLNFQVTAIDIKMIAKSSIQLLVRLHTF